MVMAMLKVKAGATLLDRRCPDWASRIDVGRLDLWSTRQCVLGQLFESFEIGLGKLGSPSSYWRGFSAPTEYERGQLAVRWVREIQARRAPAQAA